MERVDESNSENTIGKKDISTFNDVVKPKLKSPINKKVFFVFLIVMILAISLLVFSKSNSFYSQNKITGDVSQLNIDDKKPTTSGDKIPSVTREEDIIDPKVAENLLLKEAENRNIKVNNEVVDNYIQSGLEAYEMTEEELIQSIESEGVTYDEYKEALKSQIMISELINENVDLENVDVSEEEVDDYLETYEDEFQEILDDQESYEILRNRVQFKLLADKQTELVMEYIATLQ